MKPWKVNSIDSDERILFNQILENKNINLFSFGNKVTKDQKMEGAVSTAFLVASASLVL